MAYNNTTQFQITNLPLSTDPENVKDNLYVLQIDDSEEKRMELPERLQNVKKIYTGDSLTYN